MPLEIIPTLTEAELADYAARALSDAAAMYHAAKINSADWQEMIDIITASMTECFDRAREVARDWNPDLCAEDQKIISQNMHTCLRTIAAASLALVPLYDSLETYWAAKATKLN